jgi:hypothetical protein
VGFNIRLGQSHSIGGKGVARTRVGNHVRLLGCSFRVVAVF